MLILLIEDEDVILNVLDKSLRQKGHCVELAKEGEVAWQTFMQRPDQFGLIISDVKMSGINGVAFVERLRAQGYCVPVILMSGHLDETIPQALTDYQNVAFLPKPFGFDEFYRQVKKFEVE